MKTALLLLVSAAAAFGALPIVQSDQNGNNSGTAFASISKIYPSANASGNLLIAVCIYYNTPTVAVTVTDSLSNTWLSVPQISLTDGSAFVGMQVFYVPFSKAGTNTPQCNYSPNAGFPGIQIYEVVGYGVKDQTANGSGSGTANVASGSVTTGVNPEFVFAATSNEATPPAPTQGAGYTLLLSGTITGVASEYLVQTTAGAQNGTFTASAATVYVATVVTFKAKNTSPAGVL